MRLATRVLYGLSIAAPLTLSPAIVSATPPPQPTYTRTWQACIPGTLVSCHSVRLETTAILDGFNVRIGTAITVSLTNLQGAAAADFAALKLASFWMPSTAFASPNTTTVGTPTGGATGSPTAWRLGAATSGSWSRVFLNGSGFASPLTPNGRIGGCTTGSGPASPVMYTCGAGQAVVFSFSMGHIFNADQVAELALQYNNSTPTDFNCSTNTARNPSGLTACTNVAVQTYVTPEPITIALLGTGLLGIGGVQLRRRKNKKHEG